MKKILLGLAVLLTFSVHTVAEPISNFQGQPSATYINGLNIEVDDSISYTLSCGANPGVYTATFPVSSAFVNGGEAIDVQGCVSQPGTYYFAFTAFSVKYSTESAFSNEMSRGFTAQDIGMIPMAPVLIFVGP